MVMKLTPGLSEVSPIWPNYTGFMLFWRKITTGCLNAGIRLEKATIIHLTMAEE
jgi:hypothetical protein